MADIKKFLNADGVSHLWSRITAEVAKEAARADAAEKVNAKAIADEATRAKEAEAGLNTRLGAVEADYLKAADKTELNNAIALKADQTALDAVSAVANAAVKQADYDLKVAALEAEDARIVGLVEAEAERAGGVEAGLDERLTEVETFFKTAEGETIDQAMDTLVEIQKYITEDGAAADQMVKDIAANKKAIEDHVATDHDFAAADATLKAELEGKINLKAAQADLTALTNRVTATEEVANAAVPKATYDEKVAALEGADSALAGRVATLEGKFTGDESVATQIATAKQEAIDAAAADATTKANTAETNAKDYADGLAKNYDAAGAAATAEANAKKYADDEIAKIQALTNKEIDDAIGYVAQA